ncbi:hypothetical protein MJH12_06745, partial [bacterium]|nr:hypothetical protein [bacterium]
MLKKISSNQITLFFGVFFYLVVSCFIICNNHHFYDDEVFNLSKLDFTLREIITLIQSGDVHPPMSYILNKVFYDIFDSFYGILLVSCIFNLTALVYFYKHAINYFSDDYSKAILFNSVFLNGGLLLWTNSVRWYTYWIPLFIFVYTFLLKNKKISPYQMLGLSFILSLMTYINYLSFLFLITLFFLLFFIRKEDFTFKNIIITVVTYLVLCSYQIHIFLNVHLQNGQSQMKSFLNSFLNCAYGIINGGSVFIANPIFLMVSFMTLILLIYGVYVYATDVKVRNNAINQSFFLLITMCFLMIITGVSGKFRNVVALSIPFYFILAFSISWIRSIKLKKLYVVGLYLLTIISIKNIITHSNTGKKSYNLPLSKLKLVLESPENSIIFTYDPTILFYLRNSGYRVVYLYERAIQGVIDKPTKVYLLKTYQGALRNKNYQDVLKLYNNISKSTVNHHNVAIPV